MIWSYIGLHTEFAQCDIDILLIVFQDGSYNSGLVMESLKPEYQSTMGQRTGLSFYDAKIINMAYCQGNDTLMNHSPPAGDTTQNILIRCPTR